MLTNIHDKMQSKIIAYPFEEPIILSGCVLVGGCFDLLHYGHLSFLKSAADLGNLVVALEKDSSIVLSKGNKPIHTHRQRAEILAELMCVSQVLLLPPLHNFSDYLHLVQDINPAILAITQGDPQTENKTKQANLIGAKVVIVNDLIDGLSSSLIKLKHL